MERRKEAATIVAPSLPTVNILTKLTSVPKGHAADNPNNAEIRSDEKLDSSPTARSYFDVQCRGLSEDTVIDCTPRNGVGSYA